VDPERVSTRRIERIAFANDASVYRLVPRAVVHAASVAEIRALFRFSHERGVPLTFRAAGTSLSGQAVTDGVLVVLSRHFRGVVIEDEGRRVRVEPGIIGGLVNRHLAPHGVKTVALHPGWVQTEMGGPNALISSARSVEGLRRVIEGLTQEQSGGLISYDGRPIPW